MESAESLLEGLDPEQRLAAESLIGPVRIIASAGSGKTKTISHRIAYGIASGVYAPEKVLALSYTARSAAELRTRINSLGAPAVQ
jgi:Superfamily I DNA and RNA helicases